MKKIQIRKIQEPNPLGSLVIRNFNTEIAEIDMVEKIHRHNFYYILVIEKGDGTHQIDFTNYSVNDFTVFIIRPGQVHELLLKKGSKGYLMGFDSGFYSPEEKQKRQAFREVSYNNSYHLGKQNFNILIPILERILYENSTQEVMYKENIKANLDLFFIELFRQTKSTNNFANNSHFQEMFEKLLEKIETHICSHKKVTDYAAMLNLSTYQVNAISKNMVGKTCSHLINEHLILEAKRLLLSTSNQINEIAYHLCYEDPAYFIRFFKKNTGFTPEAFRQKFR